MPWSKDDLPPSVKNKDWSDHQKETFVAAANAALKEYDDDEGKAIATGTAAAEKEVKNATRFPQIFYCKHMLPGIVGYENENILIDADSMKRAAPSMVGKPVYVQHQKVNLPSLEGDADGWVVECFYNELDGWLWAKCLAVTSEAHQAIESRWSVSNAYLPVDWEGEGQHLNVDYDRKIRNYKFTHLAIVPNPRYEEAKIFTPEEFKAYQEEKRKQLDELQNSKLEKETPAMLFFRNKKEPIKAGEDILDSDFTEIKNDDGTVEIVTVGDLKKAKQAEKANAKKNEKMVDDDEEIEVDGEKVNMGALKECYKNMKKNADEKEKDKEKENEEEAKKKEEEKENAKKAEAEKAKKQEKVNEITNASNKAKANPSPRIETMQDKAKRGKQLYG